MEDSLVVNAEGWRLCLLSNFRLEHDGELVVKFTKRRQDVLLAYLALHPDQAHARPAVAELLWPGKPLKLALNRLTEILTVFNKQLRALELPVTLVDAGYHTIQLGCDIRTDVQDLEDAMAQAMVESDPAKQEALLAQVVNLHGAGLLPVLNEPWVAKERVRLRATRDEAAHLLARRLGAEDAAGEDEMALSGVEVARYVAAGREMLSAGSGATAQIADIAHLTPQELAGVRAAARQIVPKSAGPRARAEACVALVESAEPHLTGPDRAAWFARLDMEHDAIIASIEWALAERQLELAQRLTGAIWRYWYERGKRTMGQAYLVQALMFAPRAQGRWYAKAANGAGALALMSGDLAFARRRLNEALAIWHQLGDNEAICRVLDNLGIIAFKEGDLPAARKQYGECIAMLRRLDNPALLAAVLRNAALVEIADGKPDEAEVLLRQRLSIGRQLGDHAIVAWTLVSLAGLPSTSHDVAAMAPLVDEAQSLFEKLADQKGLAACLRLLGYAEQHLQHYHGALAYYNASLSLSRMANHFQGVGESLRLMASVAEAQGDRPQAQEYYQQALMLLEHVADSEGATIVRSALADVDAGDERPEGRE